MSLFRYYAQQNGDKPGPWKVVENTLEDFERAKQDGAAFISTMAFEYEPEKGKPEPRRYGDLVIDFDSKEDPEIARQDCIRLVHYLSQRGVRPELLHYHVTGNKGFHLVIPACLFWDKGDPLLPMIYDSLVKFIVARLWPDRPSTIDPSMYSMGKGKLLRLENILRGVGTYKVPVTWDELSGTHYSELIKLANAPRQIEAAPWDGKFAEPLTRQFLFHKAFVHNPSNSSLVNPMKLISKCAFMRHCNECAETLSEPEWHAMISVLKGLGKTGRWLSHELSCSYPSYDWSQTEEKFDRVVPNISCDKIKALFDCGCDCGVATPSKLWTTATPSEASEAAKSTEAQQLLKLSEAFELYPSDDGEPCADVRVGDHRETYRLKNQEFKNLLSYQYFNETGKPLKALAANDLLSHLIAQSLHGNYEKRKIHIRVAHLNNAVYIDLCDDRWRAIEITTEGWHIVDEPPVRFRRTLGMLPLPVPEQGGSVKELRRLLNIEEGESILLEAWLLGLLSTGPFPVLILEGEQGTAKSTTTEILRQLIDPSSAPTRAAPRNEQDLIIAANNSHIIALDNLSGLSPWISDALCRIASGGSFSARRLFTNEDEVLFTVIKPIVLNGIDQIAERHDLADRSLRVTLPVIAPQQRLTRAQLEVAFAEAAPKILAGLCDGVSCALRNRANVQVENSPRMADFTAWCVAAEEVMPWKPGEFLEAYRQNQGESIGRAIEADDVASAIMTMMEWQQIWEGSPSDLLRALDGVVGERYANLKTWPQTPTSLGKRLSRTQAFLRKSGIEVDRQSSGNRLITIRNPKAKLNPNVFIPNGETF